MATSGNKDWAYMEAQRRAKTMDDAYSIYKHRIHPDYIVRNAAASPPNNLWDLDATFQRDGSQSFKASFAS